MRPPSKRGTAVIPVEQQRHNSLFKKMSLLSWQAQYRAKRATSGSGEKQLAQAAQA
jgi:hypothetical protein